MLNPRDVQNRDYHGCRIVSSPEATPRQGSDGWHHVLMTPQGEVLGEFSTLAAAIAEAKSRRVRAFLKEESNAAQPQE